MSREVCGICWCPYDDITGDCACPPPNVQKSTLREAAQQALEALEQSRVFVTTREKTKHPEGTEWYDERITALRAALAEQPTNPAPGYCKHCKQYTIEEPLSAEPVQEPVAWMCADESLVHKGYSRFSRTRSGDWNIPVYTEPQESITCERCEELAADKATWYRMAEMFASRLEELKKKGTE